MKPSSGSNREVTTPGRAIDRAESTLRSVEALEAIEFRSPTVADGAALWELAARDPVLDTNSCYAYLLLCRHFSKTCQVAFQGGSLAGFVTGYVPPSQPDTIFVWQVAVSPAMRKQGLARRLLRQLLMLPACTEVTYLEATVSPSNRASQRLFRSLAEELKVPFQAGQGFHREHFRESEHEDEPLIRIGPWENANENVSETRIQRT